MPALLRLTDGTLLDSLPTRPTESVLSQSWAAPLCNENPRVNVVVSSQRYTWKAVHDASEMVDPIVPFNHCVDAARHSTVPSELTVPSTGAVLDGVSVGPWLLIEAIAVMFEPDIVRLAATDGSYHSVRPVMPSGPTTAGVAETAAE